jgi:hypothetical protein
MPTSAWAYRPFVSTDAAVADPKEVEIELGYFNLERTRRDNTIMTPSAVLNYGFAKNWEAVGEFRVEASDRTTRHCSASSGSRRRRACFSTPESGAVSVARRRTGSSLLV